MPGRLARLGRLDGAFLRRLAVTGMGRALGRGLGLLFTLVLAALFLPADFGYARWAMSVAGLASIPMAAGATALARGVGAASGAPVYQRGLAQRGLAAIAAMTGVCALLTGVALGALGRPIGGPLTVLVGMALFSAWFGVYRGTGSDWRMVALYAGGNAFQLVLVLLVCGALGITSPDLALAIYGFGWLVIALLIEWRAPLALLPGAGVDVRHALATLGRVWAPLLLAETAYAVWAWGDVVLVERLLGAADAGYYGLARTVVTVFLLVPEGVVMLLLPLVASQGQQAGGLTRRLLGLTAVVSAALLAAVLLVVPPLVQMLGAGRYAPAATALPGLAVGMAVYALYLVLEGHLVGMGRAGAHAAGISVMAVTTLGGAAGLLPVLGLAGAGLAFAAGALAGLAVLVLVGLRPFAASRVSDRQPG